MKNYFGFRTLTKVYTLIAMLYLLLEKINALCGPGCLKCTSDDKCLFCDISSGYTLGEDICHKIISPNCLIFAFDGRCLECNKGFYPDLSTGKCVRVLDKNLVLKCGLYSSNGFCLYCEENFVLISGNCEPIIKEIYGCRYYTPGMQGACQKCSYGFNLSADKKSCVRKKIDKNCSLYNSVKCIKCKSGYFLDSNYYLAYLHEQQSYKTKSELASYLNAMTNNLNSYFVPKICRKIEIEYCDELIAYKKCGKCSKGAYLDKDEKCQLFPKEPIINCLQYSSFDTCTNCKQGFYLKSNKECIAVDFIANCTTYASDSNTSQCSLCSSGFYLSSNTCKALTLINNCTEYSIDKIECEICSQNTQLTSDKMACLDQVTNCQQYLTSSKVSTQLECDVCQKGFYYNLTTKVCVIGSVDNCQVYEKNENKCKLCENKFYLDNNFLCQSQPIIENCLTYSDEYNKCDKCKDNAISFLQVNHCVKGSLVPNCIEHDLNGQCLKCDSGYVVDEFSRCVSFSDINCYRIKAGNCIECQKGYFINLYTKLCLLPNPDLTDKCAKIDTSANSQPRCSMCNPFAIPLQIENADVCYNTNLNYLKIFVENCERYKLIGDSLKCWECSESFFLDYSKQTCVSICNDTIVLVTLIFTGSKTFINYRNRCEDIKMPKCLYAIQNSESSSDSLSCIKCKDNNYPFFDYSTDSITRSKTHIAQLVDSKIVLNSLARFNPVICENSNPILFLPNSQSTPIQNCALYNLVGGKLGCLKCEIGFTGTVFDEYITGCDDIITDCDFNARYHGIIFPSLVEIKEKITSAEALNSCFKCRNGKIPVLFVSKADDETIKYAKYDLANNIPTDDPKNVLGKAMACLSFAEFDMGVGSQTTLSIPVNCAHITYFVNKAKSMDMNNNPSIICTACAPGFKPTFDGDLIILCTKIANCDLNTSLNNVVNKCAVCSKGFAHGWSNGAIDFSVCRKIEENDSCIAFDLISSACKICSKGYYLNSDGACEQLTFGRCSENSFNDGSGFFDTSNPLISWNINRANIGHGCLKCDNGFVKLVQSDLICVTSSYITTNFLPVKTHYVVNCEQFMPNYNKPLQILCGKCRKGFVLSSDNLNCYIFNQSLANCDIALSSSSCSTCLPNYVLVFGKCLDYTVKNCISIVKNSNPQICDKCSNGYYLQDNKCLKSLISNCKILSSKDICLECEEGFQLLKVKNGVNYCFPIPEETNCKIFNPTLFQGNQLSCVQCIEGFRPVVLEKSGITSICLVITPLENCEIHDIIDNNFNSASFRCKTCYPQFFVMDGLCKPRQNYFRNCTQLDLISDSCAKCADNFFLSNDKLNCLENPHGIYGCAEYSDAVTCIQCKENRYLNGTECTKLTTNETVSNCSLYTGPNMCKLCINGFMALNGTCIQIIAKNCLTAVDPNSCDSCDKFYALKTEGNYTNCVRAIDYNCADQTTTFPVKCNTCRKDYYPDSKTNQCVAVTQVIKGCKLYQNATICQECEKGMALAKDKTACIINDIIIKNIDSNCLNNQILEEPMCVTCKPGMYFMSGNCVSCKKYSLSNGCFNCAFNEDNQEFCSTCSPKFYMAPNGTCIAFGIDLTANKTSSTQTFSVGLQLFVFLAFILF